MQKLLAYCQKKKKRIRHLILSAVEVINSLTKNALNSWAHIDMWKKQPVNNVFKIKKSH